MLDNISYNSWVSEPLRHVGIRSEWLIAMVKTWLLWRGRWRRRGRYVVDET